MEKNIVDNFGSPDSTVTILLKGGLNLVKKRFKYNRTNLVSISITSTYPINMFYDSFLICTINFFRYFIFLVTILVVFKRNSCRRGKMTLCCTVVSGITRYRYQVILRIPRNLATEFLTVGSLRRPTRTTVTSAIHTPRILSTAKLTDTLTACRNQKGYPYWLPKCENVSRDQPISHNCTRAAPRPDKNRVTFRNSSSDSGEQNIIDLGEINSHRLDFRVPKFIINRQQYQWVLQHQNVHRGYRWPTLWPRFKLLQDQSIMRWYQ